MFRDRWLLVADCDSVVRMLNEGVLIAFTEMRFLLEVLLQSVRSCRDRIHITLLWSQMQYSFTYLLDILDPHTPLVFVVFNDRQVLLLILTHSLV